MPARLSAVLCTRPTALTPKAPQCDRRHGWTARQDQEGHAGRHRGYQQRELLTTADWWGIVYASLGFSVIYAALDQGNRLDWFRSGLINGLLISGTILVVAFVIHELVHDRPWINLRFAARGNFPLLTCYIAVFRFVILSTSYIIPQYLATIQNYRAMETGSVLIWIALPQFLIAPIVATILRLVDARLPMAFGFALVGWACFMAGQLTHDWATDDFLPSQIIQAVGQSFALTSVVWFNLKHLQLKEVLTFGVVLQTARLLVYRISSIAASPSEAHRRSAIFQRSLVGLHGRIGHRIRQATRRQLHSSLVSRDLFGRACGTVFANWELRAWRALDGELPTSTSEEF
jgi:MFS transporter, DHA2 family, multidrug resistance protein